MLTRISKNASILGYSGYFPKYENGLFMACGARLVGRATLGHDVSLWFQTVVRADVHEISIGDETNIQDGAIVHCTYERHATHIGSRVSIGHAAVIHGCTIEDDVLVGMGALIMDGVRVGKGSVIGAGTLVTERTVIPEKSLVVGRPGRVIRTLSDEESSAYTKTYLRYLNYVLGYEFEGSSK